LYTDEEKQAQNPVSDNVSPQEYTENGNKECETPKIVTNSKDMAEQRGKPRYKWMEAEQVRSCSSSFSSPVTRSSAILSRRGRRVCGARITELTTKPIRKTILRTLSRTGESPVLLHAFCCDSYATPNVGFNCRGGFGSEQSLPETNLEKSRRLPSGLSPGQLLVGLGRIMSSRLACHFRAPVREECRKPFQGFAEYPWWHSFLSRQIDYLLVVRIRAAILYNPILH
jgi:hypothetical protein